MGEVNGAQAGQTAYGWYVLNNAYNTGNLVYGTDFQIHGTYNSADLTSGTTFTWSFPENEYSWSNIRAYPNVLFGGMPRGVPYDVTGTLPIKVADIDAFDIEYSVNYSGQTSGFNVAFDIWFTSVPNGTGETITNELMIWLHKGDVAAYGEPIGRYVDGNFSGTIYYEPSSKYISIISDSDLTTGHIDLAQIINVLSDKGIISDNSYLASVSLGAEAVEGSGSLTINELKFDITSTNADGDQVLHHVDGNGVTETVLADDPGQQPPVVTPPADTPVAADIVGTAGSDTLYGDARDNVMDGKAGNDTLFGGDGNDKIYGGDGNDLLYGEAGNDSLYGELGDDQVFGGLGNDILQGGDGNDSLYGELGDDQMFGGDGNDQLFGSLGNDVLQGGKGDDILYGEDGNDTLTGDAGNDTMYGGAGNDVIILGPGKDLADGGAGADTYKFAADSQDGVDRVFFSASDGDKLDFSALMSAGAGASVTAANLGSYIKATQVGGDTLISIDPDGAANGAHFTDTVVLANVTNPDLTSLFAQGQLKFTDGTSAPVTDPGQQVPVVTPPVVTPPADTPVAADIVGTAGSDTLYGDARDNVMDGKAGNDALFGADGNDKVYGGDGNDLLYGEGGNDSLYGDLGDDQLFGGLGNDILQGGDGNDSLYGELGDDQLFGGDGNDQLFGSLGNDVLQGGKGDDILYGEDGNDTLTGDAGNDTMYGGAGNDVIILGAGKDLADGGAGADTYKFAADSQDGADRVFFSASDGDKLDFSALMSAGAGANVTAANLGSYIKATQVGGDTLISIDPDGAANGAHFTDTVVLANVTNPDLTSLFEHGQFMFADGDLLA